MNITQSQLLKIGGANTKSAQRITGELAKILPRYTKAYGLDKPHRMAQFLAQLAHESAHFKTTVEYASGAAYEGRRDLGNTRRGDGKRFKGRGLIQLTGRANYKKFGDRIGVDLIKSPEKAARFPIALQTALEYWKQRKLNSYADRGDILNITRRINGGYNGMNDRYQKYGRAALVLLGRKADVKAFQRDTGLSADGVVGPHTAKALHNKMMLMDSGPIAEMPKPKPVEVKPTPEPKEKGGAGLLVGALAGISALAAFFWDKISTFIGGLF